MRALHPATRQRLRDVLGEAALPFAEAVVGQAAHPLGATGEAGREEAVTGRLLRLYAAAATGDAAREAVRLAADPVLLAAVFQNVDLLHEGGDPHADAVSVLVLQALHHLCPAD